MPLNPNQKQGVSGLPPKLNPKDLSNEELEYIIKTGKLPPRIQDSATHSLQSSHQTTLTNPLQQTSNVFQNYLGNSTVNYDKENFVARGIHLGGTVINYDDPEVLSQMNKNYNSPRPVKDLTTSSMFTTQ